MLQLSFQEWTQQVQDILNTKKFGDIAFGDKDFKNAIEYYSKVRRYTFSLNSSAVEELELDSFGLSIMPSSLVSTYSLLVEDVLEVVSDAVVIRKAAASRIQRLSKLTDSDGSSTMPPSIIRVLNLIV
ncbi:hypothetical protein S83_035880 [Arachis hypogaea]